MEGRVSGPPRFQSSGVRVVAKFVDHGPEAPSSEGMSVSFSDDGRAVVSTSIEAKYSRHSMSVTQMEPVYEKVDGCASVSVKRAIKKPGFLKDMHGELADIQESTMTGMQQEDMHRELADTQVSTMAGVQQEVLSEESFEAMSASNTVVDNEESAESGMTKSSEDSTAEEELQAPARLTEHSPKVSDLLIEMSNYLNNFIPNNEKQTHIAVQGKMEKMEMELVEMKKLYENEKMLNKDLTSKLHVSQTKLKETQIALKEREDFISDLVKSREVHYKQAPKLRVRLEDVVSDKRKGKAQKPKWSAEEVEALKAGIKKQGVGNWTIIHEDPEFRDLLGHRTIRALKDKWRHLTCPTTPSVSFSVVGNDLSSVSKIKGKQPVENKESECISKTNDEVISFD